MRLSEYIKKKNGVPLGHPHSLKNNLRRSLGAKNFSAFWEYWNPVFGYYLGIKVYRPLKKILPARFSLLFTFVFCGIIHDIVTTIVRKEISCFFTVWFFLMGIAVLISKKLDYNFSSKPFYFRVFVNLSIITGCLLLTYYLNDLLDFY